MASGLPIACSDKQPMPEFLKENGFYFNSYDVQSIANALEELILSPEKQQKYAALNLKEVEKYCWKKTSKETFQFIVDTYSAYLHENAK